MDARSHDAIAPLGQDVTLADGTLITVKPITLGQLPEFVKVIRPAFGALVALAPAASSPGDAGGQGADSDAPDSDAPDMDAFEVLDLIAEHGPALQQAVCITTGMEPERAAALNLEETLDLLGALWAVNRDFFVRRVMPLLNRGA